MIPFLCFVAIACVKAGKVSCLRLFSRKPLPIARIVVCFANFVVMAMVGMPRDNMMIYKYVHINHDYWDRAPLPSGDRFRAPCYLALVFDCELSEITVETGAILGQCRYLHKGIFGELPFHVCAPRHGSCVVIRNRATGVLEPTHAKFSYLGDRGMLRDLDFIACVVSADMYIGFHGPTFERREPWCMIGRLTTQERDPHFRHWLENCVSHIQPTAGTQYGFGWAARTTDFYAKL